MPEVLGKFLVTMIAAPLFCDITTGTTEVIASISSQELILRTINLAITAIVAISVQLGTIWIKERFKKSR